MNSIDKLYDELLQEHPELKNSKVDIKQAVTYMKEANPTVVANVEFKNNLKQRIDAIASYDPQKTP